MCYLVYHSWSIHVNAYIATKSVIFNLAYVFDYVFNEAVFHVYNSVGSAEFVRDLPLAQQGLHADVGMSFHVVYIKFRKTL